MIETLQDTIKPPIAGSYVRILYQSYNYGPLNAPTRLKFICSGLRINEKSVPALVRLHEETEEADNAEETITDFNAPIAAGLYRLLVAFPDMPFVDEERVFLPQARSGYKETRSFSTQTTHASIGVQGSFEAVSEERVEVKKGHGEIPLELDEMQASIDAMLFVIGTIPDRYYKFNAILRRNIAKAKDEVERLQTLLVKTETTSTKSVLSIPLQKTLLYYHMLNALVNAWNSVWIKFGPVARSYHPTDVRHGAALERAESCLNRFHTWRRIMEEDKASILEAEVCGQRGYSPALLWRDRGYKPPYIHLERGTGGTVRPITYVAPNGIRNNFLDWKREVDYDSANEERAPVKQKAFVGYAEREALTKFRRIFVATMGKTGVYRDHELNRLLEELLQFQGPNLNDENLIVDFRFPTHYGNFTPSNLSVRQQIKKEFHLNVWLDEALGKNTSAPVLAPPKHTTSTECQTETRGISASARATIAARSNRSGSSVVSRRPYEALSATSIYSLRRRSMAEVKKENESSETLTTAMGMAARAAGKNRVAELKTGKKGKDVGSVVSLVETPETPETEPYEKYELPPFYAFKKIVK
jgi:hypothetical protein